MGMFDGLIGGIVGAGMVSVVNGILEKHGGVQGGVSEFEKNGLGDTIKSWVGTGANQPVSPSEVHQALGLTCCSSYREVRIVGRGLAAEARAGAAAGCRSPHSWRHHSQGIGATVEHAASRGCTA
jgi:Uncharacterized protein conserved in bacteria